MQQQLEQENLRKGRDKEDDEENEGNIKFGRLKRKGKKGTIVGKQPPSQLGQAVKG